ncbi:MAG: elongation factor G, partial [Planctomycetota bacterium]|nr:elongation factor G [Planctomycetota bacterium]
DVFDNEHGEVDFSSVEDAHKAIVEQVVEVDDSLTEKYLAGTQPTEQEIHAAFEKALREAHLTPICFCSSNKGVGVKELLHVFVDRCPSPLEGNPRPFHMGSGDDIKPFVPDQNPDDPLLAHVFKVTTDPFVGKLAFFRVHQGRLKHNSQVYRNDEKKAVRIGHVLSVMGKDTKDVDEVIAGDIGAVAKLEEIHTGDCLHDSHDLDSVEFEAPPMPRPMYGLAITPKSRGDETKVGSAVQKLMEEDPTFVVERVAATKQTVARGVGELHLRIMIEKLMGRFSVDVATAPPRVAYKETITSKAEGHHRHKKQTGGAGQFGEVFLRIEPLKEDSENGVAGFEFADETFGGSVPKQFMPAIEKGIRQVLSGGAIAGYPMTGVRVAVYDGKHHPVDSKEVAFVTAGKRAFIDAVQKARPVLLEPYVHLEVTAPASYMGDLTSDISGKRGRVQGTDMLPGDLCVVKALAPLSEILNYSSQLKSMTQGQGSYTMDYSHDEPTPPNVQQDIVAQFKPHEDED